MDERRVHKCNSVKNLPWLLICVTFYADGSIHRDYSSNIISAKLSGSALALPVGMLGQRSFSSSN